MSLYKSETEKITPKIEKYLNGTILDIGCGNCKIKDYAIGVDVRRDANCDILLPFPENIYILDTLIPMKFKTIFSSHCLEHIELDYIALKCWTRLLDINGVLILYLPDGDYYDNKSNKDHKHDYKFDFFINSFKINFPDMKIIEKFLHIETECYSFCLVAQKN